jgi:hypothetical protein
MKLKYYDLLSNVIIGIVLIAAVKIIWFKNQSLDVEIYIAGGYILGYIINAISSLMEPMLYWLIGGMPSDRLLTPEKGQDWTGIRKVKFYEAHRAIEKLKSELGKNNASTSRMFACAMHHSVSNSESRVLDFNAQYAFSRAIFTCTLVLFIFVSTQLYDIWYFWIIGLAVLLLTGNRFREKGFYFAREVLNEYLKGS